MFDLFGLPHHNPVDRRMTLAMYDEPSRIALERLRADAVAYGRGFSLDARIIRPDGDARWIRLKTETERRHGRTVRLYGVKQDITDERARWDALRRQAECDALTGIAGRATFQREFHDADAATIGALLLVDLDHFKQVNDTHGHAAGDECLRTIARRLARFPDATLTARIGGDEFAILLPRGRGSYRDQRRARPTGGDLRAPDRVRRSHLCGQRLSRYRLRRSTDVLPQARCSPPPTPHSTRRNAQAAAAHGSLEGRVRLPSRPL